MAVCIAFGFCCNSRASAQNPDQQQLVVWLRSGEKIVYYLNKMPQTRFQGSNLLITTNVGNTVTYPLSQVLRYTYEGIVDSVDGTSDRQNVRFSPDGSAVTFENLPDDVPVELYSTNGQLLERRTQNASDGKVTVSIRDKSRGVYIVKAGRQTIKLIKR